MINASFSSTGRDATISGAYQYDTGQRLKMHGLPSPSELAERDDFLSGDVVTVQAQFGFTGDSQTEASIAEWIEDEEGNGYWLAKVPDVYMLKNQDVHVYVYVSYGQTETSMRSKTVYEAVFRPISRPAPSTNVTPDQTNAWDRLVVEINTATGQARDAAGLANGATETAINAANAANAAAERATADVEVYLSLLSRTAVAVERIDDPYAEPTVDVTDKTDEDGLQYKELKIGIPQSIVTVNEQAADENGNITLTPEHVGALPATHQTLFEFRANVDGIWSVIGDIALNRISIPGILKSDSPVVDVVTGGIVPVSRENVEKVTDAWSKVYRIDVDDGYVILYCFSDDIPSDSFTIKILCVR